MFSYPSCDFSRMQPIMRSRQTCIVWEFTSIAMIIEYRQYTLNNYTFIHCIRICTNHLSSLILPAFLPVVTSVRGWIHPVRALKLANASGLCRPFCTPQPPDPIMTLSRLNPLCPLDCTADAFMPLRNGFVLLLALP